MRGTFSFSSLKGKLIRLFVFEREIRRYRWIVFVLSHSIAERKDETINPMGLIFCLFPSCQLSRG